MSSRDLAVLARENIDEAIAVAREIMLDPLTKDADRMRAVEFFADRGYGKAAQAVIAVPMTKRLAQQLYGLSDADLLEIIDEGHEPKRISHEGAIDAEVVQATDPLLD
jgi:hypothetical protein